MVGIYRLIVAHKGTIGKTWPRLTVPTLRQRVLTDKSELVSVFSLDQFVRRAALTPFGESNGEVGPECVRDPNDCRTMPRQGFPKEFQGCLSVLKRLVFDLVHQIKNKTHHIKRRDCLGLPSICFRFKANRFRALKQVARSRRLHGRSPAVWHCKLRRPML